MPRIVVCARAYPPDIAGGGEISSGLIASGLAALGAHVRVVTFNDTTPGTETIDGVEVVRLSPPFPYWSVRADQQPAWKKVVWHATQVMRPWPGTAIRNAIRSFEPTVVHTSTIEDFGPSLWRWCRTQQIPVVHTLRSYNLLHRGATLYDPRRDRERSRDLLSYSRQRFAENVDGVIGISHYVLQQHRDEGFFRHAKTAVIGNPIDQPVQQYDTQSSATLKLGYLGRIAPEKGLIPMLAALRHVEPSQSWQLDIAGEGPPAYIAEVRRAAEGLPVRLVGWQPSRSFLAGLDLLLVPSRWHEPFGRIVVEAYSIGLPVLCSRRGGLTELVREDVTGWTLQDWTPEAITDAMQKCRTLDRAAIRNVAQEYQPEAIAQQHLDFYAQLSQ